MKAIVYEKYGAPDVLQLREVEKPVPAAHEVLIKVYATTATSAERMMRTGKPYWGRIILGLRRPRKKYRILGIELAGEIESTGKDVKRFKKGDKVFGFSGFRPGACAEYICLPEKSSLALMPAGLSYEESTAIVDGFTTSLFFLRDKGNVRAGQKVLIIGASGSIGTSAVQIAKHFGANVTGVCSAANIALVKSLGADEVIDYTKEDFTKSGETWDIIFDTVGKNSFSRCKASLSQNGIYLPTVGLINNVLMVWTALNGGKRVKTGMSVEKNEALLVIKELVEAGKVKPVIDRRYPLEQTAEAHRYVEQGHKKGNVVITIEHDSKT
jgi:NADPH2:quinone reductase